MEQFGTPEEVYTRPATTFVASFIGSPPMNLLYDAPNARVGTIVGVRPEHLDITDTGWALKVEAVELLGAERLVYGRWVHGDGKEMVIIRTEESSAVPVLGSTIHVTPRPDRVHLFDASNGKRL
jgi:sn-glycerol 3-phosphate transport system ATP-binding protein